MSSKKAYVNSNYELIDFDPVRGMHWCRVVGDSMRANGDADSLPDGTLFRIDPYALPGDGDMVVVSILGGRAMCASQELIGRLGDFEGGQFVDPLNPMYELIAAPGTYQVIGVLSEVSRQ